VDYSTLSIKVPTNRISSVFGFMKQLYKSEKRLARESYRKNVKVLHRSEIKSASESTDTTVEEIRTMIRNELSKQIESDYSVKVQVPKTNISAPKAPTVIKPIKKPIPVKERKKKFVQTYDFKTELCKCRNFVQKLNFDAKKYETDLGDVEAKYRLLRGLMKNGHVINQPCNRRFNRCPITNNILEIVETNECKTVLDERKEQQKVLVAEQERKQRQLVRMCEEMEAAEAEREAKHAEQELEKFVKIQDRNRQYCRANMRKTIPNDDDLTNDFKALQEHQSNNDEYYKYQLWRVNNTFYGAKEFSDMYCGWDFTRKTKWKLTHN